MKRTDWQNAFGEVDEDFHLRLRSTLDGLEERDMKKRKNYTAILLAAALIVALLAGAGIAASQLGVFHMLDSADPIVPLEGAQEMVGTNLGSVENDLVKLTAEEAVFDGQGALVQLRIAPKDAERYVLFDSMLQDAPEELFETERVPVELAAGEQEFEMDGRSIRIVNGEDVRLLVDGAEVEIPASAEEALAQNLPIYTADGRIYYADMEEYRVLGSRDGREILGYWPLIRVEGETEDAEALGLESFFDTLDAETQADGSVIVWASGYAEEPLDVNALTISCGVKVYPGDETIELDALTLTLPRSEAERRVRIEPMGDGTGERFKILSGSIAFTKVRGYMQLDYSYKQAENGEEMGIDFRIYDADGKRITTGSGSSAPDADGSTYHLVCEMQSFAEVPDSIWLEAKVIGEDKTLGRVECRLIEE